MSKLNKAARERLEALKHPATHQGTNAQGENLKGHHLPGETQAKHIQNLHQHRGSSAK